jgi:hypothetical protein
VGNPGVGVVDEVEDCAGQGAGDQVGQGDSFQDAAEADASGDPDVTARMMSARVIWSARRASW